MLPDDDESPIEVRRLTAEQQALAAKWTRFAWKYARKYAGTGLELVDLAAAANVGLCEEAARFEPSRGLRFSTYAKHWILSKIRAYCAVNRSPFGKLGRSQQQIRRLLSEIDAAEEEFGDGALVAVALRHGLDPQTVALVLNSGDSHTDVTEWLLVDSTTPEDILIEGQERKAVDDLVHDAVGKLLPREALIVQRRVMNDKRESLATIGRDLGVSRERVRQLEARAIGKLSRTLAGRI